MGKKVSILSRLKGLFVKDTGTNLSKYQSDVEMPERYETKEYKVDEHLYAKKIYLEKGMSMVDITPDIDGYMFYKLVDHAGYQVDDVSTYTGEVYVLYSNVEPVTARVDEFKVPGGLIASRYIGKPLLKGTKKK